MQTESTTAWWSEVAHLRPQQQSNETERVTASPTALAAAQPAPRRASIVRRPGAPKARSLVEQRRRTPRPPARPQSPLLARRPDRIAAWAALLGLVLVLMAAATANAAGLDRFGSRTLKSQMKGADVTELQAKLHRLRLLKVAPTGHFGSLTAAAVRRYQRSRCLTADGIAGPATLSALKQRKRACSSRQPSGGGRGGSGGAINRLRVVTWYGPGWYGRRTACGNTLTSRL